MPPYDDTFYLDYPPLVTDTMADKHGHCDSCGLYSATFNGLCRECFDIKYMSAWQEVSKTNREEKRAERLKIEIVNKYKKRRERGLAKINLRQ